MFVRLAFAVLLAFAGMVILKSHRRTPVAWATRLCFAVVTFGSALWIVVISIPFVHDPGIPTFSIVGSATLIAGLAAEELVGADIRRVLRM